MKKGQGLSLTTIVVAAISLLVLVILSVIFIGRMGGFAGQVGECENKGGKCAITCGIDDAVNYPTQYAAWTCNEGEVCCISPE